MAHGFSYGFFYGFSYAFPSAPLTFPPRSSHPSKTQQLVEVVVMDVEVRVLVLEIDVESSTNGKVPCFY